MRRTRSACASVLAAAVLGASGAPAAWTVDESGNCVRTWTSASLARGPSAMLNAPLLPFRSAVGGFQLAREDKSAGMQKKILLPPTLAVAGGGMGLLESVIWLGTGLADTATGGYFEIAPEEATELSVDPVRPAFAANTRPAHASTDRCGR